MNQSSRVIEGSKKLPFELTHLITRNSKCLIAHLKPLPYSRCCSTAIEIIKGQLLLSTFKWHTWNISITVEHARRRISPQSILAHSFNSHSFAHQILLIYSSLFSCFTTNYPTNVRLLLISILLLLLLPHFRGFFVAL